MAERVEAPLWFNAVLIGCREYNAGRPQRNRDDAFEEDTGADGLCSLIAAAAHYRCALQQAGCRCTIGREIKRCHSWDGQYWPGTAHAYARARRMLHIRRPNTDDAKFMAYVADRLQHRWSPDQIAERLKNQPPPSSKPCAACRSTADAP